MRDELITELETELEAEGGAQEPDLESVLARGHQILARRRISVVLSLVAVVALASAAIALVPTKRSSENSITDTSPRPEISDKNGAVVESTTEQEQAEIFAFRALAATELMDPFGKRTYGFTYRDDTTETPEGAWRVGFAAMDCAPQGNTQTCRGLSGEDPELGNALTDTFVIVQLEAGSWEVVDVEGNMLDEERNRVIGFTLAERDEPSHWEMPAVSARSLEGEGEGFSVTALPLWVGPYPTKAPGSVCTISATDGQGNQVGQQVFYLEPPRREFERGGWVMGRGVQGAEGAEEADVTCHQYTGAGWDVASDPELVREADGSVVGVVADLVWRGGKGFTSSASCRASLLDGEGAVVWEGTGRVESLLRSGELKDYPYRTQALITTKGERVEAESVGDFSCRSDYSR